MTASHGQLIVLLEGEIFQKLPLTMNVLRIGRVPESGLQLSNAIVSRNHAEMRMEAQGPILTDLGSTYGTTVNGQRLLPNEPHMLTDGAAFQIGPYTLIYQATEPITHSLDQDDGQLPKSKQSAELKVTAMPQVPFPLPHVPEATMPEPRTLEDDPDSIYLYNLPDTFQENNFLRRFLLIFEDIWEPLEQRQDHISMYFDPRTCPESFLPWLASWSGLVLPTHRIEVHRHFLTQAMELYNWRGTRYGLIRMIEVCTGMTPEILEIPTRPFVFLVRITIPPDFPGEIPDDNLIEELIQTHKPAHVGYLLEVNR
jgi:phage tail-like protein